MDWYIIITPGANITDLYRPVPCIQLPGVCLCVTAYTSTHTDPHLWGLSNTADTQTHLRDVFYGGFRVVCTGTSRCLRQMRVHINHHKNTLGVTCGPIGPLNPLYPKLPKSWNI